MRQKKHEKNRANNAQPGDKKEILKKTADCAAIRTISKLHLLHLIHHPYNPLLFPLNICCW